MEHGSDRFNAALRRSHDVYSYIEVHGPNKEFGRLDATGGNVLVDGTASVRRRIQGSCVDRSGRISRPEIEALFSVGCEVHPYRGIRWPDGTYEAKPLGVFPISEVEIEDGVNGGPLIAFQGYDRSRTVSREKFSSAYTVDAGTNIVTAIERILGRTYPDLDFDAISTTMTTTSPMLFDAGADPWEACVTLAKSLGCEVFFGTEGEVVIAPPVDIDALPSADWTYIEGPTCTLLELKMKHSDDPGFNGVVLTGESPGDEKPAVRSIVWDDEPTSPTYYLGPYGQVPTFITDQNVKTQAEADAAAHARLKGLIGRTSGLDVTAAVHPGLDAGDVVQVERERSKVSGLYVVDGCNIPLGVSGTQSIALRSRRTLS